MGSGSYWLFIWLAPAIIGIVIAVAKPPAAIDWISGASAWWERQYVAAKAKGGFWVGGVWRWSIWGIHRLHLSTQTMSDPARRAGVRAALFFYIGGASVFLVGTLLYVAISLVIGLILLAVVIWALSKFLGWGGAPAPNIKALGQFREAERSPAPRHGPITDGPRREHCRCTHGCATSAIITGYSCGCRTVEIENDRFAGSDCTDFSAMRARCAAVGDPG